MQDLLNLSQASVSIPDYIDRKTQAPAVEDAALFTGRSATLNEGGNPGADSRKTKRSRMPTVS